MKMTFNEWAIEAPENLGKPLNELYEIAKAPLTTLCKSGRSAEAKALLNNRGFIKLIDVDNRQDLIALSREFKNLIPRRKTAE